MPLGEAISVANAPHDGDDSAGGEERTENDWCMQARSLFAPRRPLHRGAGSDRRSHTIIAKPKGSPLDGNAEFVRESDELFPKRGCIFGEHSLFSPNIEPPRKFCRPAAEESSPFRRHGKQSRLRTADLVRRASALHNTYAKWLCRNFHPHARRSKTELCPESRMYPA